MGDIGNPKSFAMPVRYSIIAGAYPIEIIRNNPQKLLPDFIQAARLLQDEGAAVITTSCGFLTLFQEELQHALDVPVLASSLFNYNTLAKSLPDGKRPGILTIAASSLSKAHLAAAGIPDDCPIGTTEGGEEFTRAILENREALDIDKARRDNVEAATALKARHPDLGAILLECTNMPPYADAIRQATGLPVYSILDGINDLWKRTI